MRGGRSRAALPFPEVQFHVHHITKSGSPWLLPTTAYLRLLRRHHLLLHGQTEGKYQLMDLGSLSSLLLNNTTRRCNQCIIPEFTQRNHNKAIRLLLLSTNNITKCSIIYINKRRSNSTISTPTTLPIILQLSIPRRHHHRNNLTKLPEDILLTRMQTLQHR